MAGALTSILDRTESTNAPYLKPQDHVYTVDRCKMNRDFKLDLEEFRSSRQYKILMKEI